MTKSLKVLIVDDDEGNRLLLTDIFQDKYTVTTADSGSLCLKMIAEETFDLILLDVNMPDMSGYDVCKKIKSSEHPLTPVIFVSASDVVEDRLQGFECGAEDYITKPFEEDKLIKVVDSVLKQQQKQKMLEKQSREAMQTAFQAMASSAELGVIVRYLQSSYQCETLETLSDQLLETLEQYGLNCCLLFRMMGNSFYFGCSEDSIEGKVLGSVNRQHRIIDYGAKTLLNDEHVTILVKNMPLDKHDEYGRYKDNLAILIEGTEARCRAIELALQLQAERKHGITTLSGKSQVKLVELKELINHQKRGTEKALSTIAQKIEDIVFRLGLDEAEEDSIIDTVENAIVEAAEITHFSDDLERAFALFVDELDNLANK